MESITSRYGSSFFIRTFSQSSRSKTVNSPLSPKISSSVDISNALVASRLRSSFEKADQASNAFSSAVEKTAAAYQKVMMLIDSSEKISDEQINTIQSELETLSTEVNNASSVVTVSMLFSETLTNVVRDDVPSSEEVAGRTAAYREAEEALAIATEEYSEAEDRFTEITEDYDRTSRILKWFARWYPQAKKTLEKITEDYEEAKAAFEAVTHKYEEAQVTFEKAKERYEDIQKQNSSISDRSVEYREKLSSLASQLKNMEKIIKTTEQAMMRLQAFDRENRSQELSYQKNIVTLIAEEPKLTSDDFVVPGYATSQYSRTNFMEQKLYSTDRLRQTAQAFLH